MTRALLLGSVRKQRESGLNDRVNVQDQGD